MTAVDADVALRQFERDSVAACLAMALVALLAVGLSGGATAGLRAAGGVVGGGALVALSYRAIKGGVGVLLKRVSSPMLAVKFFTRYALLAVAAYAMLTCFRLHPVGVLAGATSPFLAALMQVARMSRAQARRQHP